MSRWSKRIAGPLRVVTGHDGQWDLLECGHRCPGHGPIPGEETQVCSLREEEPMNRAQRRAVARKHGKTPEERKYIQQAIRERDEAERKALETAALDAAGFEVVTPRVIVPGGER